MKKPRQYKLFINGLPYKISPPDLIEARKMKKWLCEYIRYLKPIPRKGFIGRPRRVDRQMILNLRVQGLSMDAIARKLKVSKGAVQYSIKQANARADEIRGGK